MPNKKKEGFCVYFFGHRGIGRQIILTNDMEKTKKELKAGQPNNDITNIVCDADKKTAIKKYNDLVKKSRKNRHLKKKSLKKKSLKKKSLKKKS